MSTEAEMDTVVVSIELPRDAFSALKQDHTIGDMFALVMPFESK